MRYIHHIFISLALSVPQISSAAQTPRNLSDLLDLIMGLMELAVLIIFSLTFFFFMWGIVKGWIIHGAEASGQEEGRKVLTAGIIGLVVMFSVWGLVGLIKGSLFGW